jgi:hypothetical protein
MSNSTISDFLYLSNNDVSNLNTTVPSLNHNINQQDNPRSSNLDYNTSSLSAFNFSNVPRPNLTYSPSQPPQNVIPNKSNNLSFGFDEQSSLISNPNPQLNIPQQRQLMPIAPKGIPTPPALTVAQQQQQIPNQQFHAINKLSENIEKFMSDVDQRLTALEKITREILVNQKTQKDFIQQQYNQILSKLTELSESKEKATNPPQSSSPSVSVPPTTTSTTTTKSYREREKEKEREQELADAQLAAQLQSQLDLESRVVAAPPPPPAEKDEKCPICDLRFPISVLEKHCNDVHFNDSSRQPTTNSSQQSQSQDSSWLGRFFGKSDTKQPEQPQPMVPPNAIVRTQSSAALPYQQQYVLAPAYIQNPQGQPQYLYRTAPAPGQVAPTGYTAATQVYYDSQGNVYNPNVAR